jgi:F0F1-type ATP synthase membrane subunit b/b'
MVKSKKIFKLLSAIISSLFLLSTFSLEAYEIIANTVLGELILEEEATDGLQDLILIYTGQTASMETYIPHSDIVKATLSVYPEWFRFTLKLVDPVPEKPEFFTSFTVGIDGDEGIENNCPDMPFDRVDTIYSVVYSLKEECWKLERASYKGFWVVSETEAEFQILGGRKAIVILIPRSELPALKHTLHWKIVTEVNLVGDKTPDDGTCSTSISVYELTVNTIPSTLIKIDDVNYMADYSGKISKHVRPGGHVVEVQCMVEVSETTRKIFSNWSDGNSSNPRPIVVDHDTVLTAEFTTEHLLTVSSDYGGLAQSTWLTEGSIANISAPTIVNISTGSRVLFKGWVGDIVVIEPSFSLKVSRPLSIKATWRTQHLISLSFSDKAGRTISPSWVELSGPSEVLNLTSYKAWVDEGEWKIEKVWYKGVDVRPILNVSYDVSKPLTINMSTEVYDAKIVLKDALGIPISNTLVSWEITFPDGTTESKTTETSGNGTLIISSVPKGECEVKVSYLGQKKLVSLDASARITEEVSFHFSILSILIGLSAVLAFAASTYLVAYKTCFVTSISLKKAERRAEEKAGKLLEAERGIIEARRRREEAEARLNNASKRVEEASRMLEAARKQEEPRSWVETIEEGGRRRITDIDLRLKNKEAKNVWEKYVKGEISAGECMREWEKIGEPDALKKLRELESRRRREEVQRFEKSVEDARKEERRVMEELKQAEQQEEEAREELEKLRIDLKEAKEEAGRLREKLDKCMRKTPPKTLVEPEKPAPLPKPQKKTPPPLVEFPKPQYLNQDQIMLGMAHEFGKLKVSKWAEGLFECPDSCARAIEDILQKPLIEAVRSIGFTLITASISVAIKPATTLEKVVKEAVVHLLGLAKARGDISAYLPDALLSKTFDIIFPGLTSDLASVSADTAGGVERLQERLVDYFNKQNPKVISVKQAVRIPPSRGLTQECLCKIDGYILYYPRMRYVAGVFKCLCGRGLPKLITIKYIVNKNGYSEGPVNIDEVNLPPDTPVEAEEEKPGLCFISTAVYGTGSEASLEMLKEFRDDLMLSSIGRKLVNWYYRISPPIAQRIVESEKSKTIIKCIVDLSVALIKRRNTEGRHALKVAYTVLTVQTYVFGCMVAKILSVLSTK